MPRSVCATSGWKRSAYILRSGAAIAATGALALVAVTAKPAGAAATKSPWLAQTRSSSGTVANSGAFGVMRMLARPNSRCGAGATSPPSVAVISCIP